MVVDHFSDLISTITLQKYRVKQYLELKIRKFRKLILKTKLEDEDTENTSMLVRYNEIDVSSSSARPLIQQAYYRKNEYNNSVTIGMDFFRAYYSNRLFNRSVTGKMIIT